MYQNVSSGGRRKEDSAEERNKSKINAGGLARMAPVGGGMSLAACEPEGAWGCGAGRFADGCGARPLLLEESKRVKAFCTHYTYSIGGAERGGGGGPAFGVSGVSGGGESSGGGGVTVQTSDIQKSTIFSGSVEPKVLNRNIFAAVLSCHRDGSQATTIPTASGHNAVITALKPDSISPEIHWSARTATNKSPHPKSPVLCSLTICHRNNCGHRL